MEELLVDELPSRGTKRKINEDDLASQPIKRIKALDQDVVNKIAAGEIIVAPMHALKELIENAVDAGSTSLEISVKDGGLKLLQITDNGHGIHKEDLPILCERFTTSKLKAFEDLAAMTTYGFRGEALASISHIAHLTVTTKTADSACAWRAHYADGKLVPAKPGQSAEPKPAAGRGGTQITVEDLFYSTPQRLRAFRSPSEEYAKILDVAGRYGIHCKGVALSCKKHGDSSMGISIAQQATTLDRIRHIYGTAVANELMTLNVEDAKLGFKASGLTSNANYHVKKTTILLFINHRSVESSALKSALQRTYSSYLPKGGHPFVYLSLEIEPQRVDVNVHPTKREVNFLNEDEIIESICEQIRTELGAVDTSRTFVTQTLLPTASIIRSPSDPQIAPPHSAGKPSSSSNRPAENNLVRTDPSERKITSMFAGAGEDSLGDIPDRQLTYTTIERSHMQIRLLSVKNLRAEVRSALHGGLTEVFATHNFVGVVDTWRRLVAIQSGIRLYLVDYGRVCHEYFYQIGLTDFGNFGSIAFSTPLDIRTLIGAAVAVESQRPESKDTDLSSVPDVVTALLVSKREMMAEYFGMEVSETGKLVKLPLLVKGYMPSLAKLPEFLMRLGPCVKWDDETDCFRTFLVELAAFYVPEAMSNKEARNDSAAGAGASDEAMHDENEQAKDAAVDARREQVLHGLEHVLFPAFRARLVATKGLLAGVLEVANLKGLYRVFERC